MTTRGARRAEQAQSYCDIVHAVLGATIPGLTSEEITALLSRSRADRGLPLRQLAEHLQGHPDALVSGHADGPQALFRVLRHLGESDYPVVLPRCTGCQKRTTDLSRFGPTGRICTACSAANDRGDCARCGHRDTRLSVRRAEGRICYPCYRTDPERVETCGSCGRQRNPITRREDGTALCGSCWTAPQRVCIVCGRLASAQSVSDDGPVCSACYRHHGQPRRPCGRCGQVRLIAKRATAHEPDLCQSCHSPPMLTCVLCGRVRPGHRNSDGEWICRSCTPRIPQPCARCGRSRPVHARLPLGGVCSSCHTHIYDAPSLCSRCGNRRVLLGRDGDGQPTCGPCSGSALDPRCRACHAPGRHYTDNKCARCVLNGRLDIALAGPDGTVSAQLQPVRELLSEGSNPDDLIDWLAHSVNAQLLSDLARSGQPITHALLDAAPQGRHEYFVRQLLVQTGVLPPRHDDLERIPAWLDNTLAGRPEAHRRLIRPFAHWSVLRRARRRAATRTHPAIASNHMRTQITIALEFLAWLDTHHLNLDTLDQTALERWLVEGNSRSYTIRYFLRWAEARGLVRDVTVPTLRRSQPAAMLDEDTRWQLLRRCLHDDALALDTRAAAALILLFGLTITRVRYLTTDHIVQQDDRTFLHTGKHPLLLPPKLAGVLKQLSTTHQGRSRYRPAPTTPRWLFPGQTPGQPMTHAGFAPKLKQLGIHARTARNAALIALATELPPAVLADLLGLHHVTAVRWADLARRDWHAYLATRTSANTAQPE